MLKSLFLAGLVLTSAFAQAPTSKPTMATLHVQPNFDFSLTGKEFRVHYSGLGSDFTSTEESALINIYKTGEDQPVISYTVDSNEKNNKKAYYFALQNEKLKNAAGEYEVEVCAGTTCSGKTPALTKITSDEKHQLTCEEGVKENDGSWTKKEDFKLPFKGPLISDWMSDTGEFKKIEDELNQVLTTYQLPPNYKTDYRKYGLTSNPTYQEASNGKKVFFAALKYDVSQYRKLFDKKKEKETRKQYAHDFCKRKYLLSTHAHLVDKNTDEIKYRYKTTLHLSGVGKQYYILADAAANGQRKVHVEMLHEDVDIADGTYKLHVIFCATEKDTTDSTFCADPIVYSQDFVVQDSKSI